MKHLANSYFRKTLHLKLSFHLTPVNTRLRFNVYKTSYRRLTDVETTSCVYWDVGLAKFTISYIQYIAYMPIYNNLKDNQLLLASITNTKKSVILWIRCLTINWANTATANLSIKKPSPLTQHVNWTYIRRSEDVLDVFWTSYVRSVYVLCWRGYNSFENLKVFATFIW